MPGAITRSGDGPRFGDPDLSKIAMADVLRRLQGRFILSLNAVQEVFKTFSKFQIEEVDCTYSVAGRAHSEKVREVIICPRD